MQNEFQKIVQTEELFFKYAKGMRDVVGKEIHTYHEILFFISGDAEFITEEGKQQLTPNTTVIIPKETFHQFIVLSDNSDYVRCVFNFEEVSQLEELISTKLNKVLLVQNEKINNIFQVLMDIENANLNVLETNVLLKSLFAQILVEIKTNNSILCKNASFFNSKVETALAFINKNIEKSLSVETIANALNISCSHLSHIFKKDMHISIYKYILKKRLLLANKKIRNSIPPEQAAIQSGFNDYSGFYIQFKKMFGLPPSKAREKINKLL